MAHDLYRRLWSLLDQTPTVWLTLSCDELQCLRVLPIDFYLYVSLESQDDPLIIHREPDRRILGMSLPERIMFPHLDGSVGLAHFTGEVEVHGDRRAITIFYDDRSQDES